jgi:hypothetical protein
MVSIESESADVGVQEQLKECHLRIERLTEELRRWKELARKHEKRAKQNAAAAVKLQEIEDVAFRRAEELLLDACLELDRARKNNEAIDVIGKLEALVSRRRAELGGIECLMTRTGDGKKHPRNRAGQDNHLELGFPHNGNPGKIPVFPVQHT